MKELEAFRKDLKELLKKHWAELSVEDGTIVVYLNTTAEVNAICKGITNNKDVAVTSEDFN